MVKSYSREYSNIIIIKTLYHRYNYNIAKKDIILFKFSIVNCDSRKNNLKKKKKYLKLLSLPLPRNIHRYSTPLVSIRWNRGASAGGGFNAPREACFPSNMHNAAGSRVTRTKQRVTERRE